MIRVYKTMEKNFNIFHGLFETGDYHVVVEKLISLLDLETLSSLSMCNKSCHKFLASYISEKKLALRMSWLNPLHPRKLTFIKSKDIIRSMIVCDDFEMILVAFKDLVGWSAHVSTN